MSHFNFRTLWKLLLCSGASLTLHAQTPRQPAATAKDASLSLELEKYTLDNGLEVILHEDHRVPEVAVSVWYHVGAADEERGKSGFAHLFEHVMFQGTPHTGEDMHFAYLESIGGSGMNGTTTLDRTNYFETVPSHELELALWLESDRMGFLLEGMTQEKLDGQRAVVKNERRQNYENRPYALANLKLWNAIFKEGDPYHENVIGSMKDLDAATLDDVGQFFERYYDPSNATLVLAGDFSSQEVKKLITKYFATLPTRGSAPKRVLPTLEISEAQELRSEDPLARVPLYRECYPTPPFFKEGDAEMDVAASVLGGGASSRLHQALVKERGLAVQVHAAQASHEDRSLFCIDVLFPNLGDQNAIRGIIRDEIDQFVGESKAIKERVRLVQQVRSMLIFSLQRVGGSSGKAELIQRYNHYLKEPNSLVFDLSRYEGLNDENIRASVQKFLDPRKATSITVEPKPQS